MWILLNWILKCRVCGCTGLFLLKDQWQDFVKSAMNFRILYKTIHFFTSLANVSLSRKSLESGITRNILSRVGDSVTNNNGFLIGWMDLLTSSLQSLLIAINYKSSQSMTEDLLLSLLDYERLLFYCDWPGSDLRANHFWFMNDLRKPNDDSPKIESRITPHIRVRLTTEFSWLFSCIPLHNFGKGWI
jgi:hypothetical protein